MGRSFRRVWLKDNLVSDIIAQLGQDRNGRLYLVWYTEGSGEPSIHLATSDDQGRTFSTPHSIGYARGTFPDAAVIAVSGTGRVYATWYESSPLVSRVFLIESSERGRTIGAPQQLNDGPRRAHHPAAALTRALKPAHVVEPMPQRLGRRKGSMMTAFNVVIIIVIVGCTRLT